MRKHQRQIRQRQAAAATAATAAAAASPARPAPMRISSHALETAGRRGEGVLSAWEVAKPAPGVVPSGSHTMAMDSTINTAYTWAAQNSMWAEGLQFLGYPYLSELCQRAEYRRPSETLAKEMTRKWLTIKSTGDDDQKEQQEKIDRIEAEFERLNVRGVIRKAMEQDGFFGRSQVYLDVGVGLGDRDEIATPLALTPQKIAQGSLKRLTVIEPMWTYPNRYNATDPLKEDFFKPSSWFVMGSDVHASRLLTIASRPVPDILKPAYAFGGLSLSQMAKPYVDNWLRTRQSVSDILAAFSVMVLKTNMADALNGGAASELGNRIALFTRHRDNRGLFVCDKDTEDFTNVSAPLGSLDQLQAQSQEHMSAVTGIPLTVLLGITPSGLNASSEGEFRMFYQWVEAQQEGVLTPPLRHILQAVQLSLFGAIDPKITFAWEPLWSLSEKEQAEVRKTEAETAQIYIQEGVIGPDEQRAVLAAQEDSPYASLDLAREIVPPDDEEHDVLDAAGGGAEPGAAPRES